MTTAILLIVLLALAAWLYAQRPPVNHLSSTDRARQEAELRGMSNYHASLHT